MRDAWMLFCLLVAGVVGAQGADRDFDAIVHRLEAHYGTRRTHIPLMGLGNFFVKVARPEGVSDFKIAVLEDLPEALQPSTETLDRMFSSMPEQGWKPFIRVRSNRDGERVEIFGRREGRHWELLLTTLERTEATVMKMRLSPEALAKWIAEPEAMARRKDH